MKLQVPSVELCPSPQSMFTAGACFGRSTARIFCTPRSIIRPLIWDGTSPPHVNKPRGAWRAWGNRTRPPRLGWA